MITVAAYLVVIIVGLAIGGFIAGAAWLMWGKHKGGW